MANTAFSPTCSKFIKIDKVFLSSWKAKVCFVLVNILFFLCVFIITLFVSDTFYGFFHEYIFGYFHDFDNWELFKNNVFAQTVYFDYEILQAYLNIRGTYQVLTMSVIVFLMFETLFLFINMMITKRSWERFRLSYGVYVNPEFHNLHHKTYRMITKSSMYIVNVTILTFIGIIGILGGVVVHGNFQPMFHLFVIVIFFLIFLFFGVYNLKLNNDFQAKYKANFDKLNWKHDNRVGLAVLITFIVDLLLGFSFVYVCIYGIPLDVFLIYLLIRYIPIIFTPKKKDFYR